MNSKIIFDDFEKALKDFEVALSTHADSALVRAGCIQYFEFCFELAWKSIKVFGSELGLENCNSPKGCLKQAFANGWIDNELVWLEMLSARNRMSHTYSASDALTIYDSLTGFLPAMRHLFESISAERNKLE